MYEMANERNAWFTEQANYRPNVYVNTNFWTDLAIYFVVNARR